MKVELAFKNISANSALSFEDVRHPHDSGSHEQVDVYLIKESGTKELLGSVDRTEIRRLAAAIQR
jgi:hypothetical protein